MIVLRERPPNWDQIVASFPFVANRRGIMFCYGNAIYAPFGAEITPALFAHEGVHSERQRDKIEAWWDQYIADANFRLAEEIPAHIAEYRVIRDSCARGERRMMLRQIAHRLAGPLYGSLISTHEAKRLIAPTEAD